MSLEKLLRFFKLIQDIWFLNFGTENLDDVIFEMNDHDQNKFGREFKKLIDKTVKELRDRAASLIKLDREGLLQKYNPLPEYVFNDPLLVSKTNERSALTQIDQRKIDAHNICGKGVQKVEVRKRHWKAWEDNKVVYADIVLAFHFIANPDSAPAFMKERTGGKIGYYFFEGSIMSKNNGVFKEYYTVGLWWDTETNKFKLRERSFDSDFLPDHYTVVIEQ